MLLCFYHLNPCGCENITACSILLYVLLETKKYSGLAEATCCHAHVFVLQRGGIHPDTFGCVTLYVVNLYCFQGKLFVFHYASLYLGEVYRLQHQ